MSERIPTGVYRRSTDRGIVVVYNEDDVGDITPLSELPMVEYRWIASKIKAEVPEDMQSGTDWYVDLTDHDSQEEYRNMTGGDKNPDTGDGEATPDDQQGESQDDDQGESEDESQGDGDGDEESEDDSEPELDDPEFGDPDTDQPIDNPLAESIWKLIRPNVVAIAEDRTTQGVQHVYSKTRWLRSGGGGSGGGAGTGLTVKVAGMPDFELDEVRHHMFPKVLATVNRDVHAYLPGPPGTGKSHMVEQVSRALGRPFGAMSFHTQSTIASLVGYMDAHGNYVRTVFRDIYENGGIMLFDEMDGASPAIGIGMNSALANGFMSFPDGMIKRHPEFVAVCTANTLGTGPTAEFAGRQKLDPATLNRFAKIFIDTDESMEDSIVHGMIGEDLGKDWLKKVRHIRRAVAELNIKHFVTMRDSINGARLIAPGDGSFSTLEALEVTILAVLSDDQRDKIRHWRG